jgi:hypothetical protein
VTLNGEILIEIESPDSIKPYQTISHHIWSVVWIHEWIIVPYIGNFIIPTDELIFFRGVAQPPTR